MGDASGGAPGPSGINDMKNLLEKIKEKYNFLHPNDNRWPCPFCLCKEKTIIQCKIHIRNDHPNLMKIDERYLLSQFEQDLVDNSIVNEDNKDNITPTDLNDFLKLIEDSIQTNQENDSFNLDYDDDEDEEVFYCPYDCKNKNHSDN